jgi:acetyltransferase-like isoleucine patch superfamily enzyme
VFGRGTVVKPFAVIQTQAGKIVFGENCAVSSFNHISTGVEDVTIGDDVRIGTHVTIMGGSRNFREKNLRIVDQGSYHKGVKIGNDVLIGTGSVIMPGSSIGDGAVIGAMSLVNTDVFSYTIVAGVPAKPIGERE